MVVEHDLNNVALNNIALQNMAHRGGLLQHQMTDMRKA